VKKNGSIPTSVHSYITADGITTIEETKETESGGKYIITTTTEKEQLIKDRLNNMFLDLQKCTHVVVIACMDRFKHYPFVRDHYTATGRTDKLAEKLKHKYQTGTTTNSFKSRSPVTQRDDGTGFSIHSRQTCLPTQPIPTYVANTPNRPTKSILSTPRNYYPQLLQITLKRTPGATMKSNQLHLLKHQNQRYQRCPVILVIIQWNP